CEDGDQIGLPRLGGLLVENCGPSQPAAIHACAAGARCELAQRLDRERIGLHPTDGLEQLLKPVISADEVEREVLGIDAQGRTGWAMPGTVANGERALAHAPLFGLDPVSMISYRCEPNLVGRWLLPSLQLEIDRHRQQRIIRRGAT